jgi:hypothetical protein
MVRSRSEVARAASRVIVNDVPPVLIVNPATDLAFLCLAERALDTGPLVPGQLQERLRVTYPQTLVRARDLSGERGEIWYVYREGHWIPSAPIKEDKPVSDAKDDLRATADAILGDVERLKTLESEKQATDPEDPRMVDLSRRADEVSGGLRTKTAVERDLSERIQSGAD